MKKHTRITALTLAIILLTISAGGCRSAGIILEWMGDRGKTPFPTLALQDTEVMPFSDIKYARPDAEKVTSRLYRLADEVEACEDVQTLKVLFEEGETLFKEYDTMTSLASLMSAMDLTMETWVEEEAYTAQNYSKVDTAYQVFWGALYDSPFHDVIETYWHPGYFDTATSDIDWYPEGAQALYARESALISEYTQKRATLTIPWNGRDMSYDDIYDIEDTEEYYEALAVWYEAHEPALGDLYLELVRTRMELAQLLGFDSYIEMALAENGADYTVPMIEALLDGIIKYIVPLYEETSGYYVEAAVDYETWAGFLENTFYDMDEALGVNFRLMRDYGLIDWEPRMGKASGAFTTYLTGYDSPFILMSYTGEEYSRATLIHEFGHFHDFLEKGDVTEALDVSEIYSQALELLIANHFEDFFGEADGYCLRYNVLYDMLDSFIYQTYFTGMELEIYSLEPDLVTLDAVEAIALRQAERFQIQDEIYEDLYRYDWVTVPHIYETPFYTVAYATSADIALQVWELSLTDESTAIDTYQKLLKREESAEFIANAEAAGLHTPFDEGEMQRIGGLFRKYLIEEDRREGSENAA